MDSVVPPLEDRGVFEAEVRRSIHDEKAGVQERGHHRHRRRMRNREKREVGVCRHQGRIVLDVCEVATGKRRVKVADTLADVLGGGDHGQIQ